MLEQHLLNGEIYNIILTTLKDFLTLSIVSGINYTDKERADAGCRIKKHSLDTCAKRYLENTMQLYNNKMRFRHISRILFILYLS